VGFVIIEAGYGYLAHSLALIADAGHNLSDVLGLLAWGASALSRCPPTKRYTYGLRVSILAALLNAMFLLLSMGAITWPSDASAGRWRYGHRRGTGRVTISHRHCLLMLVGPGDLNIRGAFLHTDAGMGSSWQYIMRPTGYGLPDLVAVVVVGTWQLLLRFCKPCAAVPAGIEPLAVQTYLAERPGVAQVHDLHIWAMSD